jgi:hypothetical protein
MQQKENIEHGMSKAEAKSAEKKLLHHSQIVVRYSIFFKAHGKYIILDSPTAEGLAEYVPEFKYRMIRSCPQ